MKKSDVLALAFKALEAYSDDVITPEELLDFSKTALKLFGVDTDAEFFDIFIEEDGDLHLILKKSIVDKMKLEV